MVASSLTPDPSQASSLLTSGHAAIRSSETMMSGRAMAAQRRARDLLRAVRWAAEEHQRADEGLPAQADVRREVVFAGTVHTLTRPLHADRVHRAALPASRPQRP